MLWAIALATPFFILWGWLSDKIGRKWIMMAGMAIAIFTYRPIFSTFLKDSDATNWLEEAKRKDSIKEIKYTLLDEKLVGDSLKIRTEIAEYSDGKKYKITTTILNRGADSIDETIMNSKTEFKEKHLSANIYWKFIGLVFLLILYVTMVYGPIAAFLVELFPTKIRYTSMSLPYHIGNGVFGGLVPFIGLLLTTTYTADPLVGLWYPIGVATLCLIIGTFYLTNKIDRNIKD